MLAIPKRLVVLLADDDESDLILLRRIFTRLRSVEKLVVVPDGEEAIACIRGEGKYSDRSTWPLPHLLFLDERMPRLSGSEVLRGLRSTRAFATLPVVILSGGLPPAQTEFIAGLNAAYCNKTAHSDEMAEAVESAMASALAMARNPVPKPQSPPIGLKVSIFASRLTEPDCIRVWT